METTVNENQNEGTQTETEVIIEDVTPGTNQRFETGRESGDIIPILISVELS